MANQHCQLPFDLANAKVLIQIDGKTVDINRYLDVTDEVRERIWQGAEQVWLAKVREGHAESNQDPQKDTAQPTEEKVSRPQQDENNLPAEEKRKFMRAEYIYLYNQSCMVAMLKDNCKIWRQMKADLLKNSGHE
ncbi:MAG: hypothetical protein LQ337_006519 [Flavoplaca oasis]|nr:MAG: hypothetical protein LQ337_006519 [Flavoplaca oasis]